MNFRSDKGDDQLGHQGRKGRKTFSCRETRTGKEHQATFKDADRRKTGRIQCKETKGEESLYNL